jgi:thiamine-monophosphate kinase
MARAPRTVGELGEDRLIEIFASEAGSLGSRVVVPNGDDAAAFVVEPKYSVVVTTDTLVEGVHFDLSYTPLNKVGRKLMAVNLSDIAAMGARPRYVLLSVTIPPDFTVEGAKAIASGICDQCRSHGVAIIGGNTTRTSGPLVLTATLIGRAEPNELIRRRGTQHQDAVFVTGSLGDANAGLRLIRDQTLPTGEHPLFPLFSALIDPVPRIEAGRALARTGLVHAMCDVSDGLGRDLLRLLVPEGLGARIDAHALPISAALRSWAREEKLSPEIIALEGGEDYELLFTASPEYEREIFEVLHEIAVPVTRIGTVISSPEIEIFMPDGSVIAPPAGFDHFAAAQAEGGEA